MKIKVNYSIIIDVDKYDEDHILEKAEDILMTSTIKSTIEIIEQEIYLVDASNNNKVVGSFSNDAEISKYLTAKYSELNEDISFDEYINNFIKVDEKEMSGRSMYYNI